MKMQMRLRGISRVSHEPDHLSSAYFVSELHAQRAWLQMRIKREMAAANIQNHVIAADGFQRDGHGPRIPPRNVFWYAVLHFRDNSVGHGERIAAVRVIILVVLLIALISFPLVANPYPINRKSLRDRRVPINWNQRPSMARGA